MPIEADLLAALVGYLDGRACRLAETVKSLMGEGLSRWPASAPLFVGRDRARITPGPIQSRIRRAFRRSGPDAQPVRGATVHGLGHTYAMELANSDVSVYTLLCHRSRRRDPRGRRAKPLYAVIRDHLYTDTTGTPPIDPIIKPAR